MAEQPQDQSVVITPGQARAVIALQFERDELVRRTNKEVGEIMRAFQEQGRMLAMVHQLPSGEGWLYRFDSVDVDGEDKPRVKLTAVPPTPEAPAETEEAGEEQVEEG